MKAKIYIGIITVAALSAIPAKSQISGYSDYRNDGSTLVVNNYYNDYDFYYSSRINRFHRSYSAFTYYSPVFTETYWYNFQPYSWGVSIYGGGGGFYYNYPVYNYGWYDPYYGYNYSWGYDPFYYSWYSPVIINFNLGYRWGYHDRYYFGYHPWYRGYGPVYNTYNTYNYYNYPSSKYSSREYSTSSFPVENNRSNGSVSRRSEPVNNVSKTEINRSAGNNTVRQSGTVGRRDPELTQSRSSVNRSNSVGDNGSIRTNQVNRNNSNMGTNSAKNTTRSSGTINSGGSKGTENNTVTRRVETSNSRSNQVTGRSLSSPARSSSSTRSNITTSRGNSSTVSSSKSSSSKSSTSGSTSRSSGSNSGSGGNSRRR